MRPPKQKSSASSPVLSSRGSRTSGALGIGARPLLVALAVVVALVLGGGIASAALLVRPVGQFQRGDLARAGQAEAHIPGTPLRLLPTNLPSPKPSPTPVTVRRTNQAPASGGGSLATRGIFRYTSTDFATMHSVGFNASTDGGVQDNGPAQAANGITGMVWVDAYSNTACTQTMTDSAIVTLVRDNVSAGYRGLRYEIGDEPTANGCAAAPVYTHITQVVHGADSSAKTWTADDQFQTGSPIQAGVPMKGTVDILAFDVYPCESGPCDYGAIDSAVQQIHAARVTNWEFIMQDFSSSPWRWPTPAEIVTQFNHWKNQGAIGFWVYAWDYQGQQIINQPGNLAALRQILS